MRSLSRGADEHATCPHHPSPSFFGFFKNEARAPLSTTLSTQEMSTCSQFSANITPPLSKRGSISSIKYSKFDANLSHIKIALSPIL